MLGNRQIFSQAKPNNNTSTPAPGKVPPPCSRGTGAATRCVSERWKISPPGHPFGYPSLHKNRRASDEHEIHSDLEQRKCKTEGKQVWEICWLAAARALLARRRRPGIAILRRALWLRTPARSRNPTRHPPLTRQAKRRHLLCGPLPEGKPPCYYGFPMVFPLKPPLTRGYHQRSIPPKKKNSPNPSRAPGRNNALQQRRHPLRDLRTVRSQQKPHDMAGVFGILALEKLHILFWGSRIIVRTTCLYVKLYIVEGSLEVKLPTIWRDEKQSRAEAERRGRLAERRSEEKE